MGTAIIIVGVAACLVGLGCVACIFLMLTAQAFEKASRDCIAAARAQEREAIAHHYAATAWWFSEFPDAQHALRLVTEEIVTGRQDSSRLRDDWKKATGRKP